MSFTRRFLLASSLARLIEKERGGRPVAEGYFPNQANHGVFVRVNENAGTLILVSPGPSGLVEVPADLPRGHAEALRTSAAGRVDYQRIDLGAEPDEISVYRLAVPGPLDLITVSFEREEQARNFRPLPWFGPEVTADVGYQNRALALADLPAAAEVELTDGALDSLLDLLEGQPAPSRLLVEPAAVPALRSTSDAKEDPEDLGIEDSVIRELARSLRPKHH